MGNLQRSYIRNVIGDTELWKEPRAHIQTKLLSSELGLTFLWSPGADCSLFHQGKRLAPGTTASAVKPEKAARWLPASDQAQANARMDAAVRLVMDVKKVKKMTSLVHSYSNVLSYPRTDDATFKELAATTWLAHLSDGAKELFKEKCTEPSANTAESRRYIGLLALFIHTIARLWRTLTFHWRHQNASSLFLTKLSMAMTRLLRDKEYYALLLLVWNDGELGEEQICAAEASAVTSAKYIMRLIPAASTKAGRKAQAAAAIISSLPSASSSSSAAGFEAMDVDADLEQPAATAAGTEAGEDDEEENQEYDSG